MKKTKYSMKFDTWNTVGRYVVISKKDFESIYNIEEKREETKFSIITTYSISDHPASITLRKEECKEGYHFKTNK